MEVKRRRIGQQGEGSDLKEMKKVKERTYTPSLMNVPGGPRFTPLV